MPAIETFDWFKKEVWPSLDQETRDALASHREYLLTIRNEDERRRFIQEVMREVKSKMKKPATPSPRS